MFKTLIVLFLVVTSLLSFAPIEAVEVKDLYQASVPINSRNNADRAIALREALAAVMVKIGGNKSVLNNQILKKSLNDYDIYLNQYHYQLKTISVAEPAIDNQTKVKQLYLFASFNEDKINQLFQQANLAIWGSLRPQVLLWLVSEDEMGRTVISSSTDSDLSVKVNDFSDQRGLPIIMPLMDLTDANEISLSDIWGRFEKPVIQASSRYLAEAIVVMRISNSSLLSSKSKANIKTKPSNCGVLCAQETLAEQNHILDWSLLGLNLNGVKNTSNQQYQGNDRKKLLEQALADITKLFSEYYALSSTSNNEFLIEVANIDSLITYVDVFDFLTNLSSVKSVSLVHVQGSSRRFNLQLMGSTEAFVTSLTLNKKLQQIIEPRNSDIETSFDSEVDKIAMPTFNWVN